MGKVACVGGEHEKVLRVGIGRVQVKCLEAVEVIVSLDGLTMRFMAASQKILCVRNEGRSRVERGCGEKG